MVKYLKGLLSPTDTQVAVQDFLEDLRVGYCIELTGPNGHNDLLRRLSQRMRSTASIHWNIGVDEDEAHKRLASR